MDTNTISCIVSYILFISIAIIFNIHSQFFYFSNIQYFSPVLNFFYYAEPNNTLLKCIYKSVYQHAVQNIIVTKL